MSLLTPGKVVELNSGGPKMTLAFVVGAPDTSRTISVLAKQQGYSDGDVFCEWFDGPDKKTSFFRAPSLKIV